MTVITKLVLLVFMFCIVNPRLIYALSLIRHGALYPKRDYYKSGISSELQAQITPIGMRQLYNLGTYLRSDYIVTEKFLSEKYRHSQIEFFSSSLQRTQFSAYSLMYGLYPLREGEKISRIHQSSLEIPYSPLRPKNLQTQPTYEYALRQGFQPIPLHQLDQILDSCTLYKNIFDTRSQQIKKQVEGLSIQQSLLIEKMKLMFKLSPKDATIEFMVNLFKDLESDKFLGIEMPSDYTDEDNQALRYIQQYYSALLNSGKFGRILSTLIFEFMREKLNTAAMKESSKKMGFVVFHSSSMWPIMVNLNLTSPDCIKQKKEGILQQNTNCFVPDYAASLIVQLHEDDDQNKFIKLKFNGKYVNVCGGNQKECDYEDFVERVKRKEEDYDHFCGKRPLKGFTTQKQ